MKREVPAVAVAAALTVAAAPAAGQVQEDVQNPGQTSPDTHREPRFVFSFDDNPSFRIGSKVRLDVRFKSQADWRDFPDEDVDSSNDIFDLHRARLGVEGRVSRYLEYQVERETRDVKQPWRDVFVNVRPLRALEVQFGRFKMPFSLEQTTGSMDLNFAYRALAATYLAPSRDIGVMAHGDTLRNALKYEFGLFREGGDNARITEAMNPVSQRTIAGRVVTRPLVAMQVPALRDLEVGAAFTAGRVPEGLNSLRAETIPGDTFVDRVYVNGLRRRLGAELLWRPGPLSVQGEVIRISEQRHGQGIDNEDLPDAIQRGWYLSGSWLLTGEDKKNNIDAAAPFLQGGFGALEIAGRMESLAFGSVRTNDPRSLGPRARQILERKDTAWTLGMNWYLNQFVRIQANVIRERREAGGTILPALGRAWSRTLRVQFQL